jgi:glycerol kinase
VRWPRSGSATSARRPSCGRARPGGRRARDRLAGHPDGRGRLATGGGSPLGLDRFRALTGLPISTYSSALKLAWLLDAGGPERGARRGGELLFGTIDTWLIWHLTAARRRRPRHRRHERLAHDADGLESLAWEPTLLEAIGVPRAMLPAIRSSSEVYGVGSGDLAGVPIAGDLGDQHAALFGQACFDAGGIKCTYGTGCFMLLHTGERPSLAARADHDGRGAARGRAGDLRARGVRGRRRVAHPVAARQPRDHRDAGEVEALARSVPDSGDVVVVPAFSGCSRRTGGRTHVASSPD